MLAESIIGELATLGVDARWTRLSGALEVEAPCVVKHLQTFGLCRVGAFTYSDYGVDVSNADIGRYCSLGSGVKINPGHHPTHYLSTHPFAKVPPDACGLAGDPVLQSIAATYESKPEGRDGAARVAIGDDVWIGTNALILSGVAIGTGAVIGAGAVVTRAVAPYDIVGGAPARRIRARFPPALVERLKASRWWDRDLSVLTRRDYSDAEKILDLLDGAPLVPFRPPRLRIELSGVTRL